MQFTALALSALSIGSAFAASESSTATSSGKAGKTATAGATPSASGGMVKVHVVKVGNSNGTLAYSPNTLVAAVGDMVQFQFAPANHTVTQSTFDAPCQPLAMNSNLTGIYSGFMPVSASSETIPTYTIMVNNTTPIWLYCSQGKHCQNGMTMVINENPAKNATRTLANYAAMAAKASVNLPGNAIADGSSGSIASSGGSSSGGSSSGSGTSGYGSSMSSMSMSSTSTSSAAKSTSSGSSAAKAVKASEALSLAALLAAGIAMFV